MHKLYSKLLVFKKLVRFGNRMQLYRCPKCNQDIYKKKDMSFVRCDYCSYQSFVIHVERPYLLNPANLQDNVELCQNGCHYAEPYGFVPMDDCPFHAYPM